MRGFLCEELWGSAPRARQGEAPANAAGRKLPPVCVPREHPLPWVSQKLLGVDRIVIQADHREIGIDTGETFVRISVTLASAVTSRPSNWSLAR